MFSTQRDEFAVTHRLIGLVDFNDHQERLVGGSLVGMLAVVFRFRETGVRFILLLVF